MLPFQGCLLGLNQELLHVMVATLALSPIPGPDARCVEWERIAFQ